MVEKQEEKQTKEETAEEEIEIIEEESGEAESKSEHEEQIETLTIEKDEVYNRMLRLQAEYDNFKRRSQKEKEADRKYKSQDIVNDLLPVLDNFERALKVEKTEETSSLIDGISMVHGQLQDALTNHGVEAIETVGQEFDPNQHHAVMQVEDDAFEANHIVEELQKGYLLKDRVIRPAMVKVNK